MKTEHQKSSSSATSIVACSWEQMASGLNVFDVIGIDGNERRLRDSNSSLGYEKYPAKIAVLDIRIGAEQWSIA